VIWHIVWLSFVGCLGMAVLDTTGTIMVKAISTGKGWLAGLCDAIADLSKITVLSISSVDLTHKFGIKGFIGVIPIAITGFLVTAHATHATAGMENDEDAQEDQARDDKIRWLEREVLVLKAQKRDQL